MAARGVGGVKRVGVYVRGSGVRECVPNGGASRIPRNRFLELSEPFLVSGVDDRDTPCGVDCVHRVPLHFPPDNYETAFARHPGYKLAYAVCVGEGSSAVLCKVGADVFAGAERAGESVDHAGCKAYSAVVGDDILGDGDGGVEFGVVCAVCGCRAVDFEVGGVGDCGEGDCGV